jgi:hypothetical protein
MTNAEAVQMVREHFESLFPRVCPNCGRRFATLREYVLTTERIGRPQSYDAELGDWRPTQIIGSVVQANCPCGSTLTLTTEGMALSRRQALLEWVRAETHRRGVSPPELLDHLRDQVRQQVLAESPGGKAENDRG